MYILNMGNGQWTMDIGPHESIELSSQMHTFTQLILTDMNEFIGQKNNMMNHMRTQRIVAIRLSGKCSQMRIECEIILDLECR